MHFEACQRCEADKIHTGGQTTCGPKAQVFSGAKGNVLIIALSAKPQRLIPSPAGRGLG
jgi:hypothetical protein